MGFVAGEHERRLVDLAEQGVHGNSHGSMFERNNADVPAVVTTWMDAQLD